MNSPNSCFLGGLTTFSTFSAEVVERLLAGQPALAIGLAAIHLTGSLTATWLGLLSVGERQAAVDYGQQLADGYRRVLTRGVAEGSLRPVPIDAIIASLPGVFSWAANGPEQTPDARIHIADELAMLVTHGLCVDRPEP